VLVANGGTGIDEILVLASHCNAPSNGLDDGRLLVLAGNLLFPGGCYIGRTAASRAVYRFPWLRILNKVSIFIVFDVAIVLNVGGLDCVVAEALGSTRPSGWFVRLDDIATAVIFYWSWPCGRWGGGGS
jgi:hypothetical protein